MFWATIRFWQQGSFRTRILKESLCHQNTWNAAANPLQDGLLLTNMGACTWNPAMYKKMVRWTLPHGRVDHHLSLINQYIWYRWLTVLNLHLVFPKSNIIYIYILIHNPKRPHEGLEPNWSGGQRSPQEGQLIVSSTGATGSTNGNALGWRRIGQPKTFAMFALPKKKVIGCQSVLTCNARVLGLKDPHDTVGYPHKMYY